MKTFLLELLNWSELWSLLMPIGVLLSGRQQPRFMRPVVVYVWIAVVLNLACDVITSFKAPWHFPPWLQSNNFLYNVHSLVRFSCFSTFFIGLGQPLLTTVKRMIPLVSVAFIVINFSFFESFLEPKHLSGTLLTVEAYLLLVYCLLYYLHLMRKADRAVPRGKDFWVVLGLSIYVVINFFIFLFYDSMVNSDSKLAIDMWNVHNIAYIVFAFFLAKAFYVA